MIHSDEDLETKKNLRSTGWVQVFRRREALRTELLDKYNKDARNSYCWRTSKMRNKNKYLMIDPMLN